LSDIEINNYDLHSINLSFIEKKNMAPPPPPKKLSGAQNLKRKRQKQDETEKTAK
jgi:hypothetical protein